MMISPTRFDKSKYTHVCVLGSGGFGKVNLYLLNGTNTFRAVKFAKSFDIKGKELHDFIREVHTLYSNQHPTIVHVFNYGIPETDYTFNPWIELEFIPCGTAFDLMKSYLEEDIEWNEGDPTVLHIILFGIAYSLAFLHHRNVIHRDVKSTNVLLDDNLEPKLSDFGFARELKPNDDISGFPHTVNYAAPELLQIKPYTNKVDVYSFGMMVFELSTLSVPFEGMSKTHIIEEVISGRIPKIDPNKSPYYLLYQQCCSFQPERRPTMWEISNTLNNMSREISGIDLKRFDKYKDDMTFYDNDQNIKYPFNEACECGTLTHLENAAERNPRAMYQIGWLYYQGICVEKDLNTAAEYFRTAGYLNDHLAMQSFLNMVNSHEILMTDEIENDIEEFKDRLCEFYDDE
ncbi:hypothetical protein TRFO_01284 [Tritrichomonas foetus]|uniref:Protein kinase domain-containing protein n=1 Tax=Tritrichomonas foetus TaxID=1144522 RepID=A0A1J4K8F2_9EUKA|nr:hypothetical protein TRFO_01284 [Tritrichomonas foetus]|eukprot:OHT07160.1 hypothetical protein TRFO_01284 [Tritrichomonas foetus]